MGVKSSRLVCLVADRFHGNRCVSELIRRDINDKTFSFDPGMAHPPVGGQKTAIFPYDVGSGLRRLAAL